MNKIDNRISTLPKEWAGPVADVLDTVDTVANSLRVFDIPLDPQLIAELTRMILDRHDAQKQSCKKLD